MKARVIMRNGEWICGYPFAECSHVAGDSVVDAYNNWSTWRRFGFPRDKVRD